MRLFNLFARKKKMSIKELYEPVLDKMWCCLVRFCPWEPIRHKVIFRKVGIIDAHATAEGIYVKSDWANPFDFNSKVDGFIDKITVRYHTTGFFETEDEAKMAYNKLMENWIAVIRANMAKIERRDKRK